MQSNMKRYCICVMLVFCISYKSHAGLLDQIASGVAQHILRLPKPIPKLIQEANLEASALINMYGYPAENHTIRTIDGYNVIYHRIPNASKIPVLVIHGMNGDSTMWIDNGSESLAYVLADAGYDVWLANVRGTAYSNHTTLTRNQKKFWDFSLDEIGDYETGPGIDYILSKTGHSRLLIAGQSLGSALPLYLLSEQPLYKEKVAGLVLMGPAFTIKYMTNLVKPLLSRVKELKLVSDMLGMNAWLTVSPEIQKLQYIFCPSGNPKICELSMIPSTGYNPYLRNTTRFPVFATHLSHGASTKLLVHIGQTVNNKDVLPRKFDYGEKKNLKKYGSVQPPLINVSTVDVPIVLIYAANDVVVTPLSVELLYRQLPFVVKKYLMPHPMTLHSDFMYAKNGKEILYDKIVKYFDHLWNRHFPID